MFPDHTLLIQFLIDFTENHRKNWHADPVYCESEAIRLQMPVMVRLPEPHDLFTGRINDLPMGFTPQVYTDRGGFGYFFDPDLVPEDIRRSDEQLINDLSAYWSQYDSVNMTRERYDNRMRKWLPGDAWTAEPGIAFPLYRMAGAQPDYKRLVDLGIGGLRHMITEQLGEKPSEEAAKFYTGCLDALHHFSELCLILAGRIDKQLNPLADQAQILRHIAEKSPENLRQGIQLVFLYSLMAGVRNYGRLDSVLAGLYEQDVNRNGLSREKAQEYFSGLFRLMDARKTIYDGRVIIGGKGRQNEKYADELALIMMRSSMETRTVLPQLTLRVYDGQNPHLSEQAFECFTSGWIYPMLYNDTVNVPAVQHAFGISENEACNYLPFGCGEYMLDHMSIGTPSGILNIQKALEMTLTGGVDMITGEQPGIFDDLPGEYASFDAFFNAFKTLLEQYIVVLGEQQKIEYDVAAEMAPFLLISILYDDCLAAGKPLFRKGARYLGGTLETYGNTNAADSLAAIRKFVFERKEMSLASLAGILRRNFKGHDDVRKKLLGYPKYGNDADEVDDLYCELHDFVCSTTSRQAAVNGLDYYLVVIINNDANTDLGFYTGASADGRRSGESLNNGNAPYHGMDRSGITALLNSLVKPSPDIHAGAVHNLKLSKLTMRDHALQVRGLIEGYFSNGGSQLMLTVSSKKEMEEAMKFPEKYANLFVRVGGFSARFIDLRPEVQWEIISRTEY